MCQSTYCYGGFSHAAPHAYSAAKPRRHTYSDRGPIRRLGAIYILLKLNHTTIKQTNKINEIRAKLNKPDKLSKTSIFPDLNC